VPAEQPIGAGAVGTAEQRAHHLLHHDQRGVGQRRFHLDHGSYEHGEPARTFETPQVLGGDDAGGPRNDGIASSMDTSCSISRDPDAAHGVEPFDDSLQVRGRWCFRPFAYPS
jgi:hypothetical protein